MKVITSIVFLISILICAGCGEKPAAETSETPSLPMTETPPPVVAPVSNVQATVSQTMNAAGYTYVEVEDITGSKIWMALPETQIKVGDKIEFSYSKEQLMANFHSKTLNRTFEKIYFLPGVKILPLPPGVL